MRCVARRAPFGALEYNGVTSRFEHRAWYLRQIQVEVLAMRIGPFGQWEIILILLVIVILFGGKRLPEMAKGIGQSVREFRRGIRGGGEDAEAKAKAAEDSAG